MIGAFYKAVAFVLQEEGGLVDDPNDPGGLTKYGIALAEHPELTAAQIRALTPGQAADIYHRKYWTAIRGDELPAGLDFVALDCAVNQGVEGCIRLMQTAAGVPQDGVLGPQTLAALRSMDGAERLAAFTAARVLRYSGDAGWLRFGKGWTHRAVLAALEASHV